MKKMPLKKRSAGAATKKAPQSKAEKIPSPSIVLKTILVPIDFSDYSKKALQYAIRFAQQFNAKIIGLYVVEPTIYPADLSFGQVGLPNIEMEMRTKGENELKQLLADDVHTLVKTEAVVRTGLPFVEIVSYARDNEVDLIIVATHGHTGVEHILFGSTTEKVLRKAPCPVLVVRSDERDFINERV